MNKSNILGMGKGALYILIAAVIVYIGGKFLNKGMKSIPAVDTLAKKVGA